MNSLLFVTTIPATINAFLTPLAERFRAQGWQVDAMAQGISNDAECLQTFDRVWDVEWSRNPLNPKNLVAAPQQIRAVVEQQGYDIVHVHTPVAAFVTRFALNGLRKQGKPKVIYTAHGFHFYRGGKPLKNAIFFSLEKLAGRWTDYLVVINREDEQAAKHHHFVPSQRLRYMPGIGVDLDYYSPQMVSADKIVRVRQELGLTSKNSLLLVIAEFNPRKRHQDILTAFAQLNRPEVHLLLAGDGALFEQMQQLASDLGIQNQVHFLGFRTDIPTLICASNAIVLASEQEGLPRSIMESLCLETPVIGTDIRGIRDLLEPDCGLLVKPGDVKRLAEAMAWVLEHPEAAKMMSKRARERMATYQLENILKLHEALYAEAVNSIDYAVLPG